MNKRSKVYHRLWARIVRFQNDESISHTGPDRVQTSESQGKQLAPYFAAPLVGADYCFVPRAGSRKLVIYFSGIGKSNGKFDFWKTGLKVGENALFLSDSRRGWYQLGIAGFGDSMEQTISFIKGFVAGAGFTQITTVGASMGGYAAVLYGSLLRGQALVFGFDSILDLPGSASEEHRALDVKVIYPDILPIAEATATRIHMYVGEMDAMDMASAARFRTLPSVTIETLRGVDHSCAPYVHRRVGLETVVKCFIERLPLPYFREAGNVMEQPQLVELLYQAYLARWQAHTKQALEICGGILESYPQQFLAHYLSGLIHSQSGDSISAIRHLQYVSDLLPEFNDGHIQLAKCLRGNGESSTAVELLSRILSSKVPSALLFHELALAYEMNGAYVQALISMRRAAKIKSRYRAQEREMRARLYRRLFRTIWPRESAALDPPHP